MATGSELQLIIFSGDAGAKPRPDFGFKSFGCGQIPSILRRANKSQECFVSGETESVANTSAFVGPVAFSFAAVSVRPMPGVHALRAERHHQSEACGLS
jgi:hypothetical protein